MIIIIPTGHFYQLTLGVNQNSKTNGTVVATEPKFIKY
jgi:hypothetical protein